MREIGGGEEKPGRVMQGKGKPREKYQYNNATQESPFREIERQNESRNKAKRKRHGLKLTSDYPGLTQQLESCPPTLTALTEETFSCEAEESLA